MIKPNETKLVTWWAILLFIIASSIVAAATVVIYNTIKIPQSVIISHFV